MIEKASTVELLNQTKNLPDLPGIYKMFSAEDKCIYVVKWSENHSDQCEYKHSNIFSVMYEREKTFMKTRETTY